MPARTRRNTRRSGGGYLTAQQFLTPSHTQPSASILSSVVSTAPTAHEIRPMLYSTFQAGAGRKTRRSAGGRKIRGGFAPSIMGSFVANAQAAIVPLALYAVYHMTVPKRGSKNTSVGGRKSRRGRRGGRR